MGNRCQTCSLSSWTWCVRLLIWFITRLRCSKLEASARLSSIWLLLCWSWAAFSNTPMMPPAPVLLLLPLPQLCLLPLPQLCLLATPPKNWEELLFALWFPEVELAFGNGPFTPLLVVGKLSMSSDTIKDMALIRGNHSRFRSCQQTSNYTNS